MQRDRHDRAVHLHLVETFPGLALVLTAIDRAVLARRGDAQRRVQRVAVVRRHLDVAAIGGRREPADLHVLPGCRRRRRSEQAHAHRDDHRVRIGRADGDRVAVQHAFVVGVADDLALQMRQLRQTDQVGTAILPAFAAIGGAHHAVDFQRGEDRAGLARMLRHAHDAAGERHHARVGMLGSGSCRHVSPLSSLRYTAIGEPPA